MVKKRKRSYWTEIGYVSGTASPESLAKRMAELALVIRAMKKIRKTVRVVPGQWSDTALSFQALRK